MTSRKPDDWMPLHIGTYLADTTHLTRDQHGAYLLLIMSYWRRGEALPAEDGQLAAMARATPAEWRKMRPIIAAFFTERDGKWFQKRCEEELEKARQNMAARSGAGKAGAEARWQNHASAIGKGIGKRNSEGNDKRIANAPVRQWQNDAPIPSTSTNSASAELTRAREEPNESPEQTASHLQILTKILGLDETDYLKHARNIEILASMRAEGLDFERHIRPAAEQCRNGKSVRSLAYIRPKAIDLRDAEMAVTSLPVIVEPTDEFGWRGRLRFYADHPELTEEQRWPAKWGARVGQQGCAAPPPILAEFGYAP